VSTLQQTRGVSVIRTDRLRLSRERVAAQFENRMNLAREWRVADCEIEFNIQGVSE